MIAKRPKSVTWLAVYVLTLVAINITQAVTALQRWQFLNSRPLTASPLYLASSGTLWGLVGIWIVWRLWKGKPETPKIVLITAFGYIAFSWMDFQFLVSDPLSKINWPFKTAATAVIILLIYWILSRPKARKFFGEMNDR